MNTEDNNATDGDELEYISKIVEDLAAKCHPENFSGLNPHGQHTFPFHRQFVPKIEGQLILVDFPYFGFVLKTEATHLFIILTNPANIIISYLLAVNCLIVIKNAYLLVEYYPRINQRFFSDSLHLTFLEVRENVSVIRNLNFLGNNVFQSSDSVYWTQSFYIVHASSPINVFGNIFCVLLVKLLHENKTSEDIWLVLRNEQVCWSVTLFSGCKYELMMPNSYDKDVFSKHKKHLRKIIPVEAQQSFAPIFHHPLYFPTMDACYIPIEAKLRVSSQFLSAQVPHEFGVSEANSENANLYSVYGKVTGLKHGIKSISSACCMCRKKNLSLPKIRSSDLNFAESKTIRRFFKEKFKIPETTIVFPNSQTLSDDFQKLFGALGCLVKQVNLTDLFQNSVVTVYLKDHYSYYGVEPTDMCGFLYSGGIVPGSIVYLENLFKKVKNRNGEAYYMSTPLTKITVLFKLNNDVQPDMYWRSYKSPLNAKDWIKNHVFWFHLDLNKIKKIKISASCSVCGASYEGVGVCPSACQDSKALIEAMALVKVDQNSAPHFQLIMKNNHVKTLLGGSDHLWSLLSIAAKKSPLIYTLGFMPIDNRNDFVYLFSQYCQYFLPYKRFHVAVKVMSKNEGYDFSAFCLSLVPINVQRTLQAIKRT